MKWNHYLSSLLNAYNDKNLRKIKAIYRSAIKEYHPDKNNNSRYCSNKTVMMNSIYTTIISSIENNEPINLSDFFISQNSNITMLENFNQDRSATAYAYIKQGWLIMNNALEELRYTYTGKNKSESNANICLKLLEAQRLYSIVIKKYNDTEWVIDAESKLKWINKISYNLSRRFEN